MIKKEARRRQEGGKKEARRRQEAGKKEARRRQEAKNKFKIHLNKMDPKPCGPPVDPVDPRIAFYSQRDRGKISPRKVILAAKNPYFSVM